ncbi:MAG: sulfite exporter TauE/SafE family protein [Erysipelotrichaceae bacterium]|nr:sulfite exporter TauE/SafE family protein [Erysipelotrichaceae bacterium]
MNWIIYILAGIGAGAVTGLAGLSAAVVITPLLVGVCLWDSYDAVTVALTADVLASLLTANTYRKNKNIDLKRGFLVGFTALIGTCIGSYVGFLFNEAQPGGLGLIAMITTISLGIKFLFKPITGGNTSEEFDNGKNGTLKTIFAMICGLGIGFVCGFTGSGGGILMLTVFTLLLGYNLKVAVGTSTMIMSVVALVGAISHIYMGATMYFLPMMVTVLSCLITALICAKFANRCDIKKLNKVIGVVLLILGIFTILMKYL